MIVLKVNNLTKIFHSGVWPFQTVKSYTVIDNISFQIKKGEILGFLGPNGSGKTTTIQILLGTLTPTYGQIAFFGSNFAQNRINILKKVGYASGYDRFPARLTLVENLDIAGTIYGLDAEFRKKQIEELLKSFSIWHMKDRQTGTLSAGQATRLIIAKAFLCNPEIVLLDEPTASLDPDVANDVRKFILQQKKERNISVLLTSHNMEEVSELCDRVLILKKGTIIADNSPDELIQSISKVYVHLTISSNLDHILSYLKNSKLSYEIVLNNKITIEIDEHLIANFLLNLSELKVVYSNISIDKPTLEDYFLNIAK